jgi:hypothetical protein
MTRTGRLVAVAIALGGAAHTRAAADADQEAVKAVVRSAFALRLGKIFHSH